jgi:hypothetical protein
MCNGQSSCTGAFRALEREGVGAIGDHHANPGVQRTLGDGVQDCLQVGPVAGNEHAEIESRHG